MVSLHSSLLMRWGNISAIPSVLPKKIHPVTSIYLLLGFGVSFLQTNAVSLLREATRSYLLKCGILQDDLCTRCMYLKEGINHVARACKEAQNLWNAVGLPQNFCCLTPHFRNGSRKWVKVHIYPLQQHPLGNSLRLCLLASLESKKQSHLQAIDSPGDLVKFCLAAAHKFYLLSPFNSTKSVNMIFLFGSLSAFLST